MSGKSTERAKSQDGSSVTVLVVCTISSWLLRVCD